MTALDRDERHAYDHQFVTKTIKQIHFPYPIVLERSLKLKGSETDFPMFKQRHLSSTAHSLAPLMQKHRTASVTERKLCDRAHRAKLKSCRSQDSSGVSLWMAKYSHEDTTAWSLQSAEENRGTCWDADGLLRLVVISTCPSRKSRSPLPPLGLGTGPCLESPGSL